MQIRSLVLIAMLWASIGKGGVGTVTASLNELRFEQGTAGFVARGPGYIVAVARTSLRIQWAEEGKSRQFSASLIGTTPGAAPAGEGELPGRTNYLLGSVSSEWRTGVRNYSAVRVAGVYPGIDFVYYGRNGALEYDFIVRPGANPAKVVWRAEANAVLRVGSAGELTVSSAEGPVVWRRPVVYQEIDGVRRTIPARFRILAGNRFGFTVGRYDRSRPLVIDPVLDFATYLGGMHNEAAKVAVDLAGNMYVAGYTTSQGLPSTVGALQRSYAGGTANPLTGDAFVAKIRPSGTLVYLTYLGGVGDDAASGIAVDPAGNVYLTGITTSTDFPLVNAAQTKFGGFGGNALLRYGDAFVAKLNPSGTQLLYSTYLGGSRDDAAFGIAIDSTGNAYVTGFTLSADFPATSGAFQTTYQGSSGQATFPRAGAPFISAGDAFVAKFSASGQKIYATYLGGSGDDCGLAIAVDSAGAAYVSGATLSRNFPVSATAFQKAFGGADTSNNPFFNLGDAFLAKLNPAGSGLVYATYFGGAGDDWALGVAVDAAGGAYITGASSSLTIPNTRPVRPYRGPRQATIADQLIGDGFAARFSADGSMLVYFTYLGGSLDDSGGAIAVDSAGNAFVTGQTASLDFPVTQDATQSSYSGSDGETFNQRIGDAFLSELNPNGELVFSTFLGGTRDDAGLGIAIGTGGYVYVSGVTMSANFPVTKNATQATYGGENGTAATAADGLGAPLGDAFVARFSGLAADAPVVAGITNAASNAAGTVSPGMIAVLYGNKVGPVVQAPLGAQIDPVSGNLATKIGDTEFRFDGVPAPIVYVSAGQSAMVVPYGVANKSTTQLVVVQSGQSSLPFPIPVAPAVPGLFSANFSGSGQGAIFNQDGTVNSSSNPAARGDVIVLYGTGEGQTAPSGVDGKIASDPNALPKPLGSVSVTVGGVAAQVLYAGAVPYQVAGLFQMNVVLPPGIAVGNQPVIVKIGSASSQANLTVAVR